MLYIDVSTALSVYGIAFQKYIRGEWNERMYANMRNSWNYYCKQAYAETKKVGKIVYHLNEHSNFYKYRYYWNKHNMLNHNKTMYQLIMTRDNKRRLAQIIKNKERDYLEL
jgi:hypothetical protein